VPSVRRPAVMSRPGRPKVKPAAVPPPPISRPSSGSVEHSPPPPKAVPAPAKAEVHPAPESAEPKGLVAELSTTLADVFTLYAMAHGFHWNVRGINFAELHELFGEIYEDVFSSVDPLAENIRKLGANAPFGLHQFLSLREIEDASNVSSATQMLSTLKEANAKVLECLNEAFAAADKANEQGVANFLADRIDQHQKWAWQLTSSLEG